MRLVSAGERLSFICVHAYLFSKGNRMYFCPCTETTMMKFKLMDISSYYGRNFLFTKT